MRKWLRERLARGRDAEERELGKEIRFHFEMQAEQFEREGLSPEEARRKARRKLGSMLAAAESTRDARPLHWLASWWQDLLHGQALLWRNRQASLLAFGVLALGIGAVTFVFAVAKAVLLDPPPFADAHELMVLSQRHRTENRRGTISYPEYEDYQRRSRLAASVAAFPSVAMQGTAVLPGAAAIHTEATVVTGNLFRTMGVPPLRGRWFNEQDDKEGSNHLAVISEGFWRQQFGGSDDAIGRTLQLDGSVYTIIGVMPASFQFPREKQDIWLPLTTVEQDSIPWLRRDVDWMKGLIRLKPGVTRDQAQAEFSSIAESLAKEYPEPNPVWQGVDLRPLQEEWVGNNRAPLLTISVAVVLLFLLAMVNLSSLLVGRTAARRRELAVRAALGASRWRIVRQVLMENAAVCMWACPAGVALAYAAFRLLQASPLPGLERLATSQWDVFTLLAPGVLLVLAPLAVSIGPALHAARKDLAAGVAGSGARGIAGPSGLRTQRWLIGVEVALAMVLCVGASLLLMSLRSLLQVDPGFRAENVLLVEFRLPTWKHDKSAGWLGVLGRILDETRSIPGVEAAGSTKYAPFTELDEGILLYPPGGDASGSFEVASIRPISPGYFAAMGIPILEGRDYNEADLTGTSRVILVSKGLAGKLHPGGDVLGREVAAFGPSGPRLRVIGIVGDVHTQRLNEAPLPAVYVPLSNFPRMHVAMAVRTAGEPLSYAGAVHRAILSVDKEQAIERITTMETLLEGASFSERLLTALLALFSASGLAIAALGTYGTVANFLSQRMRDLGIRMALGARQQQVFLLLLRTAVIPVLLGLAAGAVGSALTSGLLQSQLFAVQPTNPFAWTLAGGVILAVGVAAASIAALRSRRLDPAVVLRDQ